MRYYRKFADLDYTDEQQQALMTELAESKRLYDEEKAYEDSRDTNSRRLLRGAQEALVESNVVEGVRIS